MNEIEATKELMDLSRKIVRYKYNLSYAYSFFIFGASFTSITCIAVAIRTRTITELMLVIVTSIFIALGICFYIINRLFSAGFKALRAEIEDGLNQKDLSKGIIFSLPFIISYMILLVLGVDYWLFYAIAWYPSLGASLIIWDYILPKKLYEKGYLVSRPFFESGISLLITFFLLYALLQIHLFIENLFPLMLSGVCLLIYSLVAVRTSILAEKIFEA